jgi:hypothetical protein
MTWHLWSKLTCGFWEGLDDFAHRAKKPAHACGCGCCVVPETACPPRCVGKVVWKIHRGAAPEASVRVHNAGDVARTFAFSATSLSGVDPGSASLSVTPASAVLEPGQRITVRVRLENSSALRACQRYRAEVLVRGSFEQCIEVFVDVESDAFDKASLEQSGSLKDKTFHPRTCKDKIAWKIERGVVPEGAIAVHNTGRAVQTFHFETTPLVGPTPGGARVVVAPDSLQLGAGQGGVVRVKLQGSADLSPGQTYVADVLVRGYYEQCVETRALVEPDPTGHVEVEQGEAPTRLRAHRWQDHFQCTERCQPPPGPDP